MTSFYWKYGIPKDVTAADLDAIMKQGYESVAEAPLQDDALAVLDGFRDGGWVQVLVTGFNAELLAKSLAHHGIADRFVETHAGIRKKEAVFLSILARHDADAKDAIGVTDTLTDVDALLAVGAKAFIVPRGFHGRERIKSGEASRPGMVMANCLNDVRCAVI